MNSAKRGELTGIPGDRKSKKKPAKAFASAGFILFCSFLLLLGLSDFSRLAPPVGLEPTTL